MQEYFLLVRPRYGPLFCFASGRYLTQGIVSDLLRDSARVAGLPYQSLKGHRCGLRCSYRRLARLAYKSSWSLVLGLLSAV